MLSRRYANWGSKRSSTSKASLGMSGASTPGRGRSWHRQRREVERLGGAPTTALHRAELQAALLHTLEGLTPSEQGVQFGTPLERFEQDEQGVTAYFADDRRAQGSLLLANAGGAARSSASSPRAAKGSTGSPRATCRRARTTAQADASKHC